MTAKSAILRSCQIIIINKIIFIIIIFYGKLEYLNRFFENHWAVIAH